MLLLQERVAALGALVLSTICLGTWPACFNWAERNGRIPAHTYLDYAATFLVSALVVALTLGELGPSSPELPNFIDQLSQDNLPVVVFAILGGILLMLGNLSMQYGIALAGLTICLPIQASMCVTIGTTVNYFLDSGLNNAAILFPGVGFFLLAIAMGAIAHVKNEEAMREWRDATAKDATPHKDTRKIEQVVVPLGFEAPGGGDLENVRRKNSLTNLFSSRLSFSRAFCSLPPPSPTATEEVAGYSSGPDSGSEKEVHVVDVDTLGLPDQPSQGEDVLPVGSTFGGAPVASAGGETMDGSEITQAAEAPSRGIGASDGADAGQCGGSRTGQGALTGVEDTVPLQGPPFTASLAPALPRGLPLRVRTKSTSGSSEAGSLRSPTASRPPRPPRPSRPSDLPGAAAGAIHQTASPAPPPSSDLSSGGGGGSSSPRRPVSRTRLVSASRALVVGPGRRNRRRAACCSGSSSASSAFTPFLDPSALQSPPAERCDDEDDMAAQSLLPHDKSAETGADSRGSISSSVGQRGVYFGLGVAAIGGLCFGMFSPFFNLATNDQLKMLPGVVPPLTVYTAYFYFSLAFFVFSVIVNVCFLYWPPFGGEKSSITNYLRDWKHRGVSVLAGIICGFGNALQFMGGQAAGYAAGDMVQAYPLVSTAWGIFLFGEFRQTSAAAKRCLSIMYFMYLAAVFLLAASSKTRGATNGPSPP